MDGPTPEFFHLYTLCKGTRWTHLPLAGGWYDQHPEFVDKAYFTMAQEAKHDAEERERERRKQAQKQPAARKGGRGRRRR
jgi:hypothetical protein